MATRVITVNDILDGYVGLDLECFDRIYLNGWVPTLQLPGLWGSRSRPEPCDLRRSTTRHDRIRVATPALPDL
jgi:hypothetical protein